MGGERGRRAGINDMQCCIQMRSVAVPTVSVIGPRDFVFNRGSTAAGPFDALFGSTATTSSEFKNRIQPIMDGHAPTMADTQQYYFT